MQQWNKIDSDVFRPWYCVNIQLNVPDQQTTKASAVAEVLTLIADEVHLNSSSLQLPHFTVLIPFQSN